MEDGLGIMIIVIGLFLFSIFFIFPILYFIYCEIFGYIFEYNESILRGLKFHVIGSIVIIGLLFGW